MGAGALAGSGLDAYGARKAGRARAAAGREAIQTQRDVGVQNREDLARYREGGGSAFDKLTNLYNTGDTPADYSDFESSPDYQFALEQGNRGINQSLARRGLSDSGAALKELSRYNQGMATQQLGNYKQQMAQLAGFGERATNRGIDSATNVASNVSNIQRGVGDARASSYQDQFSALGDAVGSVSNIYGTDAVGGFAKLGKAA
jgi:hypothetical protein